MSLFGDKLYTPRLSLGKIRKENLSFLVDWSSSEIACGSYLTPEKYSFEQMKNQIQSGVFWSDNEKLFFVETKEDGRPIGTAHFWQPSRGGTTVHMALKVALPEERGQGYGTEIQKYLIIHIFDRLGQIKAIEMYTDINNSIQQRCLYKLGFELVESLVYEDQQEKRTGHLFRLTIEQYHSHPIYQFHYE
jgi:RimJ/RimL family protein N-acetyltransferase